MTYVAFRPVRHVKLRTHHSREYRMLRLHVCHPQLRLETVLNTPEIWGILYFPGLGA